MAGLSGRIAFVALDGDRAQALATALVATGASVVLIADDAEVAGRLAAGLGPGVAVFCPGDDADADARALVELAAELGPRLVR